MYQALSDLTPQPQAVLIDAVPLRALAIPSVSLIHGDQLSASIAAASIIAKVIRDQIMTDLDDDFPQYGFARHKGYGTAVHRAALDELGVTKIHRRSFAPVKEKLVKEQLMRAS